MKKSELIKMLEKIKGDYEVMIDTDGDIYSQQIMEVHLEDGAIRIRSYYAA